MKIVITGGAGFIGSCLVWKLNTMGFRDIIIVDHLGESEKWKNIVGKHFEDYIEKNHFLNLIDSQSFASSIDCLIHLGACSSTTETDATYLIQNNYEYSKTLAEWAMRNGIRFIYASSAATYGDGSSGYADVEEMLPGLRPLNMYGYSKHLFDLWVMRKNLFREFVGIKFFNVFGPNEYHKGDMKSKVYKGYHEIKETGELKLFKSYHPDYQDGEQKRDFIYVKDAVEILWYFINTPETAGIYNLGMGVPHTWNELARALFNALGQNPAIEYIAMPESLRDKYQYFTQADMSKLRQAGYTIPMTSLEDAVKDYVASLNNSYYL